jgi:hypothetical protein
MSRDSSTLEAGIGSIDRVVVYGVDTTASTILPELTPTSTRPARTLTDRFGLFMLPIATAAAFAAPWRRCELATFARGSRSGSAILDVMWLLDGWSYSEEPAAAAEVRMLNALLALDVDAGFSLDPTD